MSVSELQRILTFIVIGGINTLVDLIAFYTQLKLFKWKGLEKLKVKKAVIFHAGSFVVANVVSYFLNSNFTFADSTKHSSFLLYFVVSLIAFTTSAVFLQIFTSDKSFTFYKKIYSKKFLFLKNDDFWFMFIKCVAILITMVINFIGYKTLVF